MKRPKRKVIKFCTLCGKKIKSLSLDCTTPGFQGELYFFCSNDHKNKWEKQKVKKMMDEFTNNF